MAHTERKEFFFGKTLRITADILKARDGELDTKRDDVYSYQNIVGISEVAYNESVKSTPEWKPIEKNTDIHAIFEYIQKLENTIKGLKMRNGKLRKHIESMGLDQKLYEESADA